MTAIAVERAATLLAGASLKSFVILGIAALVVAAWRRSSASARHALWTAAVGATIALPLLAALTPTWTSRAFALRLPAFAAAFARDVTTAPVGMAAEPVETVVPNIAAESRLPSPNDVALSDGDAAASSNIDLPPASGRD